jgi:hypothetical protein
MRRRPRLPSTTATCAKSRRGRSTAAGRWSPAGSASAGCGVWQMPRSGRERLGNRRLPPLPACAGYGAMRSSCRWLDAEARSHPGHQWEISLERATGWLCGAVRGAPRSVAADGEVYPANQASGGQFTGGGRDHYNISHLSWRRLEGVGVLEAVRGHGGKENNGFRPWR